MKRIVYFCAGVVCTFVLGGMFESHIENEKNRLQEIVTLGASPYHGGVAASFLAEGPFLPDAYRQYFAAEVGWRLYETRVELEENPRFRLAESPIADGFFGQLNDTLRQTATFDAADVSAVIDAAVKTRLNFLCRPRTTLKWFVFRGEPTLSVREILLRLNYFHDYSYLTEVVKSRITGRHEEHSPADLLSVVEFERIVEEVDNDYILDLTPHQFVEILAPVFEFFSPDTLPHQENAIPTEALIIFLDDKGVAPIAQELEHSYYDNDCTEVTEIIFLEIVTRILDAIEDEQSADSTPETQPESDEHTDVPVEAEPDASLEIASIPQNSEAVAPADEDAATTFHPLKEDEFLTAPGAAAAAIALREFIRPEFSKREQPAKFTLKFAPPAETPAEITADELLHEAEESLEDVQESLEAIEESLEHLEEIAEEVGDALEKAAETLEEIEVEITAENFGLGNETVELSSGNADENEPNIPEAHENAPTPEAEAVLQQIFEEMNAPDAAEEQSEKQETADEPADSVDSAETSELTADESAAFAPVIEVNDFAPVSEINDITPVSGVNPDNAVFAEGSSDDVIALILEQNGGEVETFGYEPPPQEQQHETVYHADDVEDARFTVVEEHAPDVSGQLDEIAEAGRIMAASYPPLSGIIGDKQRERFIKKLFGKEQTLYESLTRDIDNCPSWKDAAQRFDQFLIVHNIAHDNSAAVEFRDAVKSRYSS